MRLRVATNAKHEALVPALQTSTMPANAKSVIESHDANICARAQVASMLLLAKSPYLQTITPVLSPEYLSIVTQYVCHDPSEGVL